MKKHLFFGKGNAKLSRDIATFSLPAGYSCPGAKDCFACFDRTANKLIDGKDTKFRCFAASQEALFPSVRESRWNNFEVLRWKDKYDILGILLENIGRIKKPIIRWHVSGDFFSQSYFDAFLMAVSYFPDKIFYAYTKSLPYWVARLDRIPSNLKLVASIGGQFDDYIKYYGLRYCKVLFSTYEARQLGLPIDHDDTHAYRGNKSFGVLLHGTQKAGTKASKRWIKMGKRHGTGKSGYTSKIKNKW